MGMLVQAVLLILWSVSLYTEFHHLNKLHEHFSILPHNIHFINIIYSAVHDVGLQTDN
jgi:hypothetical protein